MPVSVIVAAVALWVIVGCNILAAVGSIIVGDVQPVPVVGTIVGLLVLVGFLKRDRLAWQWGRITSLFGVLIYGAFLPFVLAAQEEILLFAIVVTVFVGAGFALRLALLISLSMRSAKEHFQMFCPECGRLGRAADFLYDKAKCPSCDHVW
jgi:hypothetical protein